MGFFSAISESWQVAKVAGDFHETLTKVLQNQIDPYSLRPPSWFRVEPIYPGEYGVDDFLTMVKIVVVKKNPLVA